MPGSRDEASFDAFFDAAWGRLQGQAYVLTGSRESAQDLTQETLLRVWQHWDTVSAMDNPEAWARKVLQNLGIEWWRKTRRRRPPDQLATTSVQPESHLELAQALQSLPANHARALVLHDGVGITVAQLALELAVPEGTVKSWLSRSRRIVAEQLTQFDQDPAPR
jgi:RNA polymerase sigma-70 factor (ECF subfamily)